MSTNIADVSNSRFEREFLQGQRDCKNGLPHAGGSDAYYRGYSAQHESDQIDTWKSQQTEKRHEH